MRRSQRRSQGFAMAMALFIIVILAAVSFGAVNYATMDSREAMQVIRGQNAHYTARAGLADAVAQLEFNYQLTQIGESAYPKALQSGTSAYYVTITPGPNNGTVTDKIWKVTSLGNYEGAERTIEAWVQLESFAKYAYFTDAEFSTSGQTIWFITNDAIKGPAHTNGFFSMSGTPKFSDETTSANGGDGLYNASAYTYNQGGTQTDPFKFHRYPSSSGGYTSNHPVALSGSAQFSFAGGQSSVPLPTDTGAIAANATKSYTGDYRFIFQDSGVVKVYKKSGSSYNFVENVTTTTSPGVTLHVTGKLEIKGTVDGRVTVGATDDIKITDNLIYEDVSTDVLGIVGKKSIIVVSPSTVYQDRSIHASMMALSGSFTVENYNQGSPRGTLHVLGGIIQKARGPVGTFGSGGIQTGYAKDYQYDDKLLNTPPLNFPTTGNIVIRSLLDKGALGSS